MNMSGINPTEFNVLVKLNVVEERTGGGIFLPDDHKDRKQNTEIEGQLVAVSPLAFTYSDEWPEGAPIPSIGDHVITAKGSGLVLEGDDGASYRLLKDKDVCAIRTMPRMEAVA